LPIPAPSRVLTHAYLKHYLQHPPHNTTSLRIHVFARAQDQYLFPGSIDNKPKRVLPDSVLCKWWRQVLGDAAQQSIISTTTSTSKPKISMFYLLGGFDYAESLGVLSKAPEPSEPSAPRWNYGHPYSAIPPPLPVQNTQEIKINDLIPAFQDDPKARQLTEWASSPIPYAGQDGDYDEVADEIRKLADASPALHGLRNKEIQEQKDQERKNLTKDSERNIDGFWQVMGNRGECAAGHVAGFFVVVADRTASGAQVPGTTTETESQESKKSAGRHAVRTTPASLPQSTYNRLWSQIHNINYASLEKAGESYEKWRTEIQLACKRTGASDAEYEDEVYGVLDVDNPLQSPAESLKRAEPPRQVNSLQVKKKKKIAPPDAQT
jgi:regulator of Ty1 transposition protein 109